ncbi:hypothetical protein BDV40DRAFT_276019 [Aspergillus tamarii]|uniref:NmrA-like domain-containing protein n=1 Tax=Aspergillus tamarii TaxID=41984 RepID=A0A5N6UIP7_ASPTM|nr:hypothetical protein BDV40DRAFT_276019 [Aspergillus tamarii]
MVTVAIAGGSSGIGRAIAQAIVERGKHNVLILSRKPSEHLTTLVVDYSDVSKLQSVLEEHNVHTVISALSFANEESVGAQLNLIKASNKAACIKRFMPSEFGAIYKPQHIATLPLYAGKFKAIEELENSTLEYTRFSNGMFMDYWFAPFVPSAFQANLPCWVDLGNRFAALPGDGNTPMVLTHSQDVGKFVAAVLDLPRWEKHVYLIGDRLTLSEFLSTAEEALGVEFEKHYDSVDMLERGQCTFSPNFEASLPPGLDLNLMKGMIASSGARQVKGELDLPVKGALNDVFPNLHTLKVRDAVRMWVENQK